MILGMKNMEELSLANPYMLVSGKMEDVMPEILPDNSVDGCITDPPYGIGFMGKEWDDFSIKTKTKTINDYALNEKVRPGRKKNGVGQALYAGSYDVSMSGNQRFQQWFYEKTIHVYRVLKPGAYFVCFGGPRTYHRVTCAIEDVGFEIRDCMSWLFGSGFPKSHNGEWGGTALKPGWEPIIIARKPIEGTVKENFAKWGTGGLDIDAGRVPGEPWKWGTQTDINGGNFNNSRPSDGDVFRKNVEGGEKGRWPANVVHDGSEEVVSLFPQSKGQQGDLINHDKKGQSPNGIYGIFPSRNDYLKRNEENKSSARFFYCAKTSRQDRNEGCEDLEMKSSGMVSNTSGQHITRRDGYEPPKSQNNHPTVKPTELMRWLIRIFIPKGGICIDTFQGSGSTGKGCMYEFRKYIGIDMDFPIEISMARMEFAIANRDTQIKMFV